jgi:hypothetical protein
MPVSLVRRIESSCSTACSSPGSLYARAGVADYWVLNLIDEVLEVYREPVRAESARYGWKYDSVSLLERNAVVTPLAAPRARIRVAALLP